MGFFNHHNYIILETPINAIRLEKLKKESVKVSSLADVDCVHEKLENQL